MVNFLSLGFQRKNYDSVMLETFVLVAPNTKIVQTQESRSVRIFQCFNANSH